MLGDLQKVSDQDRESRKAGRPTAKIRLDGESSYAGKLGTASILNQNTFFEMASSVFVLKLTSFFQFLKQFFCQLVCSSQQQKEI